MIVFHDPRCVEYVRVGHPERPVESLGVSPSCATVTQIGHGCYLRSPQERAVLCVYPRGSRRLRRFRAGYAGISEDLQTYGKADGPRGGRGRLQSVARKSSKFMICCVYESPRSTA